VIKKRFVIVTALAIVSVLFGSLFCSNLAQAPSTTTLYVDPPSIVDPSLTPGETFTVDISIADVIDLYTYGFKLKWNGAALNATNVTEGPFLKQGGNTAFTAKIWNEPDHAGVSDYVAVYSTLLAAVAGVSGSGVLATVTFLVEAVEESVLDLYETDLINSLGEPIAHTEEDGYFNNIGVRAIGTLVGRSAWPEHKHFSISKDEDGIQTLYGKVQNIGEGDGYIRVSFTVWDMGGVPTTFIAKRLDPAGDEIKTLPGEIVDLSVNVWESSEGAWPPGTYSVKATCLYSTYGIYWLEDGENDFNFTIAL